MVELTPAFRKMLPWSAFASDLPIIAACDLRPLAVNVEILGSPIISFFARKIPAAKAFRVPKP